jgi:uncharacterized protein (DUF488 family)
MSSVLYTVGFTRKGAQRFFELLDDAGVRLLLDIRARPDSQLAGFARARDLAWLLQKVAGIGYLHVPALAPAADLLADYRDRRIDWAGYETRYLGALNEPRVRKQLTGVDLDRACLLCAEPVADQCHRRLAAEWLAARQPGLEVEHLV